MKKLLLMYCLFAGTACVLTTAPAVAQVTSTAVGGAIPDDDFYGISVSFDIDDSEIITDVEVIIEGLTHTRASDLEILLFSPGDVGLASLVTGTGTDGNPANSNFGGG